MMHHYAGCSIQYELLRYRNAKQVVYMYTYVFMYTCTQQQLEKSMQVLPGSYYFQNRCDGNTADL